MSPEWRGLDWLTQLAKTIFSESTCKALDSFRKSFADKLQLTAGKEGLGGVIYLVLFCLFIFFSQKVSGCFSCQIGALGCEEGQGSICRVFSALDDLFGRIYCTVSPSKRSLKCPQWLLTTVDWIKGQLLETIVCIVFSARQVNMRWLLVFYFVRKCKIHLWAQAFPQMLLNSKLIRL